MSQGLDALDDLEQLYEGEIIGKYDAAEIDQQNGKPHIVKRMDSPHVRVTPTSCLPAARTC